MAEFEFIELTDEKVAEMARKFGISAEEVRRQWEAVQESGPECVVADMDQEVAELEATINVVAADVTSRWLNANTPEERVRNIAEFYQEGWDVVTANEVSEANVSDMFLKLSVAIYLLAEARQQIARVLDGNYRVGGAP